MGDATLGAGEVGLEVGLALRRRADCLDAEHADAAVGQPVHAFERQAGEGRGSKQGYR